MTARARVKGVVQRRGRWHYVRRVPKDMAGLVLDPKGRPREYVQIALRTDSRAEAERLALRVAAEVDAEWAALRAGRQADARKHYLAARQLCEARGFDYVPLADLTAPGADLDALVARVLSLAKDGNLEAGPAAVAAVMGTVPEALPHLGEIFESVADATKSERLKKTEAQEEKWRAPRLLAIRHFTELRGDKPFDQYTREDGLAFRKWWLDRVASGYSINMGNKELGWLAKMVRLWLELQAIERDNPFAGLRLQGSNAGRRPAFSRAWVRDKLLAPGALDGLNAEARDVLLVMVNSALGPGEILGAAPADWQLGANIPHVSIHDASRTLKTAHRGRDVPLLGVSLEAARRIAARGGITRYAGRADAWSALVGKYLRVNGLRETPRHTPYSLRHYCEDELKRAGVDYEVRKHLFGHKIDRPEYGQTPLEVSRDALERIAL